MKHQQNISWLCDEKCRLQNGIRCAAKVQPVHCGPIGSPIIYRVLLHGVATLEHVIKRPDVVAGSWEIA